MTMTLHPKAASGMALLHQVQAGELEPLGRAQLKVPLERPLGDVFVDSAKPAVFGYPEGAAFDFNAAAAAPAYGQAGLTYGPGSEAAAAAAFGAANGLGGFSQLSNVSPNPMVLLHPAPQLSPFLHPHGQQVPYYLENEPNGYALREPGPPAFYRYPGGTWVGVVVVGLGRGAAPPSPRGVRAARAPCSALQSLGRGPVWVGDVQGGLRGQSVVPAEGAGAGDKRFPHLLGDRGRGNSKPSALLLRRHLLENPGTATVIRYFGRGTWWWWW